MKKYFPIFLLVVLSSCVETFAIGALATTGTFIYRDKTINNTKKDIVIETEIDKEFIKNGLKKPTNKIGVSVDEQRVMLTGAVDNEKIISKANDIAWNVKGVKEVIDEIQFDENKSFVNSFGNYFVDSKITTQIKLQALFESKISSNNLEVITINRVVYLIGSVKTKSEAKRINELAAKTAGVKKVISHISVLKQSKK